MSQPARRTRLPAARRQADVVERLMRQGPRKRDGEGWRRACLALSAHLNAREVAEAAGLSTQSIYRLRRGADRFSVDALVRLLDAHGLRLALVGKARRGRPARA